MTNTKGKDYFDSSIDIIGFALKQWKVLLGVAIISGAMAAVFSGPQFITPKFTSEAVIYPANLGGYSGETRLEQMQQYLESNVIRDSVIKRFNLYDEYEIDSTKPTSKAAVIKQYSEHIGFDETEFESISISAMSTNPVKAKEIVVAILELLNETIRQTEREKYWEIVLINKRLLEEKKKQLDSLQGLIREYSTKYGLLDYIEQSEEVTEGYVQFLLSGKKGSDYEEVKTLYKNLEKYGRAFHNMHAQLNTVNDEYMNRLHGYEHAMKDYTKVQTYTNILVKPEVADKKTYPIRWLIVLGAMAAATGFTFAMLLILGYHKRS
jgi:capsule polysaccharide export protein KpsE/RkpR